MKKLLALFLAAFVSACFNPTSTPKNERASLRLGWIPSGSFAGEISGMQIFAKKDGLNLSIHAGGPSLNTLALVASGQDTFGTLAADEVLLANESGADLVIVGVINDISPGGFVALAKTGIRSPKDFPGHTVGILPFGSTTLLYEALLAANGIDRTKIRELTISPDLRPFLQGAYDVHPVFVYDETVTLEQQHVDFSLIEPKDFGVSFKGPVYFTRRSFADAHPEVVEAFVRTMVDGWTYALANPDRAIELLKEFAPEIDPGRERRVLQKGMDYFRAYRGQPINSDPLSWGPMAQRMVELHRLKSMPDLANVLRLEWVNRIYDEKVPQRTRE